MLPWNDWFHASGHTYGSWIPGDNRGWCVRKSRLTRLEPTFVDERERQRIFVASTNLMREHPVELSVAARACALAAFLHAFEVHRADVVVIAIATNHFHALIRVRDHRARRLVGIAKKESARALSRAKLAEPGGVWAVRSHALPIRDREHQLSVAAYIANHAIQGAAVWRVWRTPPPDPAQAP